MANKTAPVEAKTSDALKLYVSGGTTPNSTIILNRPRPNYFLWGIAVGVIAVIAYKSKIFSK